MAYGRSMREVPPQTAPYQFLLSLDEATRGLVDPSGITQTAAALLCRELGVNRCAYAQIDPDGDGFSITGDHNEDVSSIVGHYRLTDFGAECARLLRAGQAFVVEDSETDPRTQSVLSSYRQ